MKETVSKIYKMLDTKFSDYDAFNRTLPFLHHHMAINLILNCFSIAQCKDTQQLMNMATTLLNIVSRNSSEDTAKLSARSGSLYKIYILYNGDKYPEKYKYVLTDQFNITESDKNTLEMFRQEIQNMVPIIANTAINSIPSAELTSTPKDKKRKLSSPMSTPKLADNTTDQILNPY